MAWRWARARIMLAALRVANPLPQGITPMRLARIVALSLALLVVSSLAGAAHAGTRLRTGPWHAWLDGPGGPIPFGLELAVDDEGTWTGVVRNAGERIELPKIEQHGDRLTIHFDHFGAKLVARIHGSGQRLDGRWERRRGPHRSDVLRFRAQAGRRPRFATPVQRRRTPVQQLVGRWAVDFSSSDDLSVGVFEALPDDRIGGTFLTTLGDYRYLEGTFDGKTVALSCFDGAHAFLFRATLQGDGTLAGDFWSRDSWHETWTARRDPLAALPDPFGLTRWKGGIPLSSLAYPDLDGQERTLADPAFAGRARLLVLFGSWCPNCYDETRYLVELDQRYRDQGLSILALAFEFDEDPARAAQQVRTYCERLGVEYPVLVAGTANKSAASDAFPAIDRVRAYPTTIFMDGRGRVRAVHTGFSGPATGPEHEQLRDRFEALIEELLGG